jgi:hypothetical protein
MQAFVGKSLRRREEAVERQGTVRLDTPDGRVLGRVLKSAD